MTLVGEIMTTPKVSVVMPVFNSEKYIYEALKSLENQTFQDFEIICIDDGSNDLSPRIICEFIDRDNRITMLTQHHKYAGVARNLGMTASKGDYLLFLDSDDVFDEEMIQRAYDTATRMNADIVVFGGKEFSGDLKSASPRPDFARTDISGNGIINAKSCSKEIFKITNSAPWNKLYRKQFVEQANIRFESCKKVNDAFFVYMSLALAKRIIVIGDELIYYRKKSHNEKVSRTKESPDYFVNPFLNIRKELISRSLFQCLETCFYNVFLSECFSYLDYENDEYWFGKLYDILKNEVFDNPEIERELKVGNFTSASYRKYRFILNYDSEIYGIHGSGYELHEHGLYPFPKSKIEREKNVVIYGAGKVGKAFFNQLANSHYCNKLYWVDKKPRMELGIEVLSPEDINYSSVDYVVIAVADSNLAKEIMDYLVSALHVEGKKLFWEDVS